MPAFCQRRPDIGYIPTAPQVVIAMLALAKVTANDVVYDLGCGDGRVVVTAAEQFGACGVGIDVDLKRIREAKALARRAGVSKRVAFRHQDLFASDLSDASVVFLYLLPHLNLRLQPKLFCQLKPGTRVVSRDFDMGEWQPQRVVRLKQPEEATLYFWEIPQ